MTAMINGKDGKEIINITPKDKTVGESYAIILKEVAKQCADISYTDLLKETKRRFPENKDLLTESVYFHSGRRLYAIAEACFLAGLPDLGWLVVGKGDKECGAGLLEFIADIDADEERLHIWEFDFTNTPDLNIQVGKKQFKDVRLDFHGANTRVKFSKSDVKKVTQETATQSMSTYYYANKAEIDARAKQINKPINLNREEIITLIKKGATANEAYEIFLN